MNQDCFACGEKGCVALSKTLCRGGSICKFYKTRDALTDEQLRCSQRLLDLRRLDLISKYHPE